MMDSKQHDRAKRLIKAFISKYSLNLEGLTVYTEAATGPYQYMPQICAMAGAAKVYALACSSKWGSSGDIEGETNELAGYWGLKNISVVKSKQQTDIHTADIITNTGNVRPIDSLMISWMKQTAVIPLMWETWEYRQEDLDLSKCREKGILVMGTDEDRIQFRRYTGMIFVKLLLEAGLEVFGNKVFLFTNKPVGKWICETMHRNDVDFAWTSFDDDPDQDFKERYISHKDKEGILEYLSNADALICDDRHHRRQIIGAEGILEPRTLAKINPSLSIIHRSGYVDRDALARHGFSVLPQNSPRQGYPAKTAASLGISPVIEQGIAGLKVAESMARARLAGLDLPAARTAAMRDSYAQPFQDDKMPL